MTQCEAPTSHSFFSGKVIRESRNQYSRHAPKAAHEMSRSQRVPGSRSTISLFARSPTGSVQHSDPRTKKAPSHHPTACAGHRSADRQPRHIPIRIPASRRPALARPKATYGPCAFRTWRSLPEDCDTNHADVTRRCQRGQRLRSSLVMARVWKVTEPSLGSGLVAEKLLTYQ